MSRTGRSGRPNNEHRYAHLELTKANETWTATEPGESVVGTGPTAAHAAAAYCVKLAERTEAGGDVEDD